ncbi:MAG: nitrogen regulation protein NR(I) [Gammaproteobacteria bacterium]|nr:nitrogen regulation protein NR(I) [Gammaproteobacteria bacterium]
MMSTDRVWVVDDERSIRWVLERALTQNGWQVDTFESAEEVLDSIQKSVPDVVITDIRMPGADGLELMSALKSSNPDLPVIVMTAHSDLDSAVSSIQSGAFEYLPKPFEVNEAIDVVGRALAQVKASTSTHKAEPDDDVEIIGRAPAMQEVFRAIGRLSKSNVTVLINGQSGTGKERVAHALHKHSTRAAAPFVPLNMAAIPHDLVESELFGHEKGSFTGASHTRQGRFEQARGGTLFLDEIGDMPPETQTRLLRVLSDGEYYRVGGHEPLRSNVRIIAATHQNLEELVSQNLFREDLFHRLNVIRIHLPTLSERREDIPTLAAHFLASAAKEIGEEPKHLLPETLDYLAEMPWPGNVRQLENACRWIAVMATSPTVMIQDLPPDLLDSEPEQTVQGADWEKALRAWASQQLSNTKPGEPGVLLNAVPRFERIMIQSALTQTGGRKKDASILLGWGRNTLTRKIAELGLAEDGLVE